MFLSNKADIFCGGAGTDTGLFCFHICHAVLARDRRRRGLGKQRFLMSTIRTASSSGGGGGTLSCDLHTMFTTLCIGGLEMKLSSHDSQR